jgi:hypothetical protein
MTITSTNKSIANWIFLWSIAYISNEKFIIFGCGVDLRKKI